MGRETAGWDWVEDRVDDVTALTLYTLLEKQFLN